MKHLILAITAVFAIGMTGCAHKKPAHQCSGKSCCPMKH